MINLTSVISISNNTKQDRTAVLMPVRRKTPITPKEGGQTMKINKVNAKGFTIVELLIVIVIIGILATIGFVAFSGAQNKANKSSAESTLSQVKSKLGEFYAENNTYPADKAAVKTFLTSDEGGNNASLDTKFGAAADTNFVYACDAAGCDSGFTLTADDAQWGSNPAGDITVTN